MAISHDDLSNFNVRHPELGMFISQFLGTYHACAIGPESWNAALDEMYEHIYGSDKQPSCQRCKPYLERLIEYTKQFIK